MAVTRYRWHICNKVGSLSTRTSISIRRVDGSKDSNRPDYLTDLAASDETDVENPRGRAVRSKGLMTVSVRLLERLYDATTDLDWSAIM